MENMYEAFYIFAKNIVCPGNSENSNWIKDAGNDPQDKLSKLRSGIDLMETLVGGTECE
ncbi:MAG: hypothetical protein IKC03_10415 [Oscillospiraceae bacterium]|nr:hypothetical protein [Oscillospiraceae bacterium]